MKTPKEIAQQLLAKLPDDATWGKISYTMYVRSEIQKGLDDIEAGRVYPHEQVMKEMDEWLDSYGPKMPEKISA